MRWWSSGRTTGLVSPVTKKEQIFERGFGKHTGLGLFLVREILALSGITIRETGGAGRGARFNQGCQTAITGSLRKHNGI